MLVFFVVGFIHNADLFNVFRSNQNRFEMFFDEHEKDFTIRSLDAEILFGQHRAC